MSNHTRYVHINESAIQVLCMSIVDEMIYLEPATIRPVGMVRDNSITSRCEQCGTTLHWMGRERPGQCFKVLLDIDNCCS